MTALVAFAGMTVFFLCLPMLLSAQIAELKPGEEKTVIASIDEAVRKKARDDKTKYALSKLLSGQNTPVLVKERAAWALGELEIRSQTKTLGKAAQSKSLLVRSAALDALIHLRASSSLGVLIQTAKSDPVFNLRINAIAGLGLIKKQDAIPTLVKLAGEKNEEIRGTTALAMAALQSKKNDFSEALDYLGKDSSPFVQERADIGKNIVRKNTAAIIQYLDAPDPMIRLFAAQYFHYYGKEKDIKTLQSALSDEQNEAAKYELGLAIKGIKNRQRQEAKRKTARKKKSTSAAPTPAKTQ